MDGAEPPRIGGDHRTGGGKRRIGLSDVNDALRQNEAVAVDEKVLVAPMSAPARK